MDSSKLPLNIIILRIALTIYIPNPNQSRANLLAEPGQPIHSGGYSTPNTVPAFPLQSKSQYWHLDLSNELFGGVNDSCDQNLDRSRCCPVLAAWLYAHTLSALQIPALKASVSPDSESELPMMPDSDSHRCVNSLQNSLQKRNIKLPQPSIF